MTDKLAKLFETYRMNPADAVKQSKNWYNKQIALLSATRLPTSMLLKNRDEMQKVTKILPGSMYMFQYDPKNAETLPYYDTFPLVIPFRHVAGGFYGLNLHYLHPQMRVALLDKLMMFATNKNLDESTKLKFTWQTAHAASKNKFIGACVKMYLATHIESQFMKILPEHWVGALMLPTETFVNASKQQVWKESRRING